MAIRVVFDCSLFLQAVTSERGPAFRCFELVERGEIKLFVSREILAEVRDVLSRPVLRAKFPILTPPRVDSFINKFASVADFLADVPGAFKLQRDPKDEPYIDAAVAARAQYLVTWNEKHLTYLMRKDTPEGRDFCEKFPHLEILPPPSFLRKVDDRHLMSGNMESP